MSKQTKEKLYSDSRNVGKVVGMNRLRSSVKVSKGFFLSLELVTNNRVEKYCYKCALLALKRTRQMGIQLRLPNFAPHTPIQC